MCWREIRRSMGYALPSSTLTAWGLMAPVRAGLAWPTEGRGSGSLLVMAPGAVLPSPEALRMSRMLFTCNAQELTDIGAHIRAQDTELNADGVDQQRVRGLFKARRTAVWHTLDTVTHSKTRCSKTLAFSFWLKRIICFSTCMK